MTKDQNYLDKLRHSAAHLLAAAVLELHPKSQLAIGPSIENGFYYDIDFGKARLSEDDLPKIERKMYEIVKSWDKFTGTKVSKEKALKEFAGNSYKKELIEEFASEKKTLSIFSSGDFKDLCRGGHIECPSKELKHFKLLSVAGAYWRGDEKNKMLTRIYGTAFESKKGLDAHLMMLEEAKKRNHRKIGKQLDLYHFQSEAPGVPFWHPKGFIIRNELINFSRKQQDKYGYEEIQTPIMMDVSIFKQSGHWEHYREDMFFTEYEKDKIFALKPMNCPGVIQVYKSSPKSYRDLPLYLSEYGVITRKEQSGELNGMFRVMQATQDDAHLFVSYDQIPQAMKSLISLTDDLYKVFGIKYKAYLSTRPDDYMGDVKDWDSAEKSLKKAIVAAGMELNLKEKDGAFYGPKIDYDLEDSLGRRWQCATLQLDFQMPETFDLSYIDKDGVKKRPAIIHRTIFGSFERFLGILVEHFAGAFPVWLSPVQVKVSPITDRNIKYSKEVVEKLNVNNIRVELDESSETLGNKIRKAQEEKVPYMLIVGDKEQKAKKVAVRLRDGKDLGQLNLDRFIKRVVDTISTKSLNL